jgi:hypothetical protein
MNEWMLDGNNNNMRGPFGVSFLFCVVVLQKFRCVAKLV